MLDWQDGGLHAINMGNKRKLGDEAEWLIANTQLQKVLLASSKSL